MSWKIDFSKVELKQGQKLELLIKKVAFDLFSNVIMRSPVATGRFRANWQLGINSIPSGTLAGKDPGLVNSDGAGASSTKAVVAAGITNAKVGAVIYLANNLPYADRLENDYSPQTKGEGIVRGALSSFKKIFAKKVIEVRKT